MVIIYPVPGIFHYECEFFYAFYIYISVARILISFDHVGLIQEPVIAVYFKYNTCLPSGFSVDPHISCKSFEQAIEIIHDITAAVCADTFFVKRILDR